MALGNHDASQALVVDLLAGVPGPLGFCYLAGTDFAGDRLLKLRMGLREKRRAAARRFVGIGIGTRLLHDELLVSQPPVLCIATLPPVWPARSRSAPRYSKQRATALEKGPRDSC
jgi:hypothetical protein